VPVKLFSEGVTVSRETLRFPAGQPAPLLLRLMDELFTHRVSHYTTVVAAHRLILSQW